VASGSRDRGERGQGTVEWIALVLLVAAAVVVLGAALGIGVPGAELARAIGTRIVCAVRLSGSCERASEALAAEYGPELAALVGEHAPTIHYRSGTEYLPVDHRECREVACAAAVGSGRVWRTREGLPATAFTRVIDCRPDRAPDAGADGADCSGKRAGKVYIQYWLYYPDSRTEPWGKRGYHPDDWESIQVRIGREVDARASSHRSYNHRGGVRNWPTDAGVWRRSGWGPYTGELHVSAGSHAGHVHGERRGSRHTPARRLRLVPIEPIGAESGEVHDFAVTPPWLKEVYRDPEAKGT
jgi:LmbE family N-acetylglucosaminyl deacetylase